MWDEKIRDMFGADPETMLVKNRYRALRYLLKNKYASQSMDKKEFTIEMLKDCVYLDRKLRLWTEGKETVLKKELSDEFIINEL